MTIKIRVGDATVTLSGTWRLVGDPADGDRHRRTSIDYEQAIEDSLHALQRALDAAGGGHYAWLSGQLSELRKRLGHRIAQETVSRKEADRVESIATNDEHPLYGYLQAAWDAREVLASTGPTAAHALHAISIEDEDGRTDGYWHIGDAIDFIDKADYVTWVNDPSGHNLKALKGTQVVQFEVAPPGQAK